MTSAGFPHSGTPGSTPTCGSPRLFAACRALLRLYVPRHPPCALVRLTEYVRTSPRTWSTPAHRFPEHTRLLSVLSRLSRRFTSHPIPRPVFSSSIRVEECLPSCVDL